MRTEQDSNDISLPAQMLVASVAGCVATWPMTTFIEYAHGSQVEAKRSPLPPRIIADELLGDRQTQQLPEAIMQPATLTAHYGYGAATGSLYPLLGRPMCPASAAIAGAVYGLQVWAGSYLGLLPAAGSDAQARRRPPDVNGVMVLAHVVWGVSLGLLTEAALRQVSRERN